MRTDARHFPRAPVTEPDNVAVLPAGLPGDVMFAQDFAIAAQVAAAPAVAFAEMPESPLTGASGGAGIIAEPTPRLAAPGRPPRPAPVWPLTVASRPAAAEAALGPSLVPVPVAGPSDPVSIAPPATSPAAGEWAERSPTPSTPDAPSPAARWDKAGRADNRVGLTVRAPIVRLGAPRQNDPQIARATEAPQATSAGSNAPARVTPGAEATTKGAHACLTAPVSSDAAPGRRNAPAPASTATDPRPASVQEAIPRASGGTSAPPGPILPTGTIGAPNAPAGQAPGRDVMPVRGSDAPRTPPATTATDQIQTGSPHDPRLTTTATPEETARPSAEKPGGPGTPPLVAKAASEVGAPLPRAVPHRGAPEPDRLVGAGPFATRDRPALVAALPSPTDRRPVARPGLAEAAPLPLTTPPDAPVDRLPEAPRGVADPPSARTADPRPPLQQIVDIVRRLREGAVEVRLSPEELGRVRLTLSPAEAGLTVSIQAERPDTLDLLRRHADTLAADLAAEGFGEAHLDFGERPHGREVARSAIEVAPTADPAPVPDHLRSRRAIPLPNGRSIDLRL